MNPTFNALTEEQQNHISETALDDVLPDCYINNSGSTEDLKINIQKFISEMLKTQ